MIQNFSNKYKFNPRYVIVLLLSLLVFFVFHKALYAYYCFDDFHFIKMSFNRSFSHFFFSGDERSYRPLFYILRYKIPVFLFGTNDFLQHLYGISIHIINVLLFYFYCCLLWDKKFFFKTVCATIFFACNTIHLESVVWTAGSHTMIANTFLLLALLSNKKRDAGNISIISVSIFSLLSMYSSEAGMYTPILIFVDDFFYYRSKEINVNIKQLLFKYILIVGITTNFLIQKWVIIGSLFGNWQHYAWLNGYSFLNAIENTFLGITRILTPLTYGLNYISYWETFRFLPIAIITGVLFYRLTSIQSRKSVSLLIFLMFPIFLIYNLNPVFPTATRGIINQNSGGRFWYTACMGITLLMFDVLFNKNLLNTKKIIDRGLKGFLILFLLFHIYVTTKNIIPWVNSGKVVQYLQQEVLSKSKEKPNSPIYLTNIINHTQVPFPMTFFHFTQIEVRDQIIFDWPFMDRKYFVVYCYDDIICKNSTIDVKLFFNKLLDDGLVEVI